MTNQIVNDVPEKRKNELTTKKGEKEVLATIKNADGKEVELKRWHIKAIQIQPTCITASRSLNDEEKKYLFLKINAVKTALFSKSKELQNEAFDTILADLIEGAYQDKIIVYTRTLPQDSEGSLKALRAFQRIRQSADIHLLRILQAVKDIKQPQAKVVVKEAEQVNVATQINQADKQINIAQNQEGKNIQNPL